MFISVGGMVQRTSAGGISQQGRSATGVRVMNLKDEDLVSAVALVVDAGEGADEALAPPVDGAPPVPELNGLGQEPAAEGSRGAASTRPDSPLKPQRIPAHRRQPQGDPPGNPHRRGRPDRRLGGHRGLRRRRRRARRVPSHRRRPPPRGGRSGATRIGAPGTGRRNRHRLLDDATEPRAKQRASCRTPTATRRPTARHAAASPYPALAQHESRRAAAKRPPARPPRSPRCSRRPVRTRS